MVKLTPKQLELLTVIARSVDRGESPSLRELSEETGTNYSLVQRRLQALEKKRYIQRDRNKARAITLLREA